MLQFKRDNGEMLIRKRIRYLLRITKSFREEAMALTATHLRFALEMKDELHVQNFEQYLSGTMYPDSRYSTGVAREVTHDESLFVGDLLAMDDFRKGWAMHLACDRAQGEAMNQLFPEEVSLTMPGEEGWIFRTALKVLEDIDDARAFDANRFIRMMTWYQSPCGYETSEQLEHYYGLYRDLYASGGVVIEAELAVWVKAGMDAVLIERVKERANQFKEDPSSMERVARLYETLLRCYRSRKEERIT
jgi:hypothetical protein